MNFVNRLHIEYRNLFLQVHAWRINLSLSTPYFFCHNVMQVYIDCFYRWAVYCCCIRFGCGRQPVSRPGEAFPVQIVAHVYSDGVRMRPERWLRRCLRWEQRRLHCRSLHFTFATACQTLMSLTAASGCFVTS